MRSRCSCKPGSNSSDQGLTNELRATAPIKANNRDSVEAEFSALIDWFRSNSDILKVMQTDLLRAIGHFGKLPLRSPGAAPKVLFRRRFTSMGIQPEPAVLPMVAGAPGPIDFFSPQLRGLQRVSDLEEAMGKLDSDTAERYVAWSLLFACQGRWDLAAVYADSAIAVARLQHTNEAANIADGVAPYFEHKSKDLAGEPNEKGPNRTSCSGAMSGPAGCSPDGLPRDPLYRASRLHSFLSYVSVSTKQMVISQASKGHRLAPPGARLGTSERVVALTHSRAWPQLSSRRA